MISWIKKDIHIFTVFLFILIYSLLNFQKWKNYDQKFEYQFSADVAMYYSYLPAFFNNHDYFMEKTHQPAAFLQELENGRKSPKYSFGLAIMYSPLYFIAEIIDSGETEFSNYGLTKIHSRLIRIGSIFYCAFGFLLLFKLMGNYFNKITVAVSGLLVFFGSNITHYTLVESEMPHIHLFFLFSASLLLTHKWWQKKNPFHLYLLSFILGLAVLIRPSEIVFLLIPVFWGVTDVHGLRTRLLSARKDWRLLSLALFCFLIPIIPHLIYFRMLTGEWFYYIYTSEEFFFGHPKILDFLLGFRKGWFIYSPVMLFAVLGFFFLPKKVPDAGIIFPITITISIYVLSSWWCWWFGGSFGSRSVIQYYSFMIFPLAALLSFFLKTKTGSIAAISISAMLIYLNINWSEKYNKGEIHWDSMTYEAFKYSISNENFTIDNFQEFENLLNHPDYDGAKSGENR